MGKILPPLGLPTNGVRLLRTVSLSCVLSLSFLGSISAKPSSAERRVFTVAQKAFEDTQYDVAALKLQEFQKTFPKSELKSEAQMLLGQSYFFQDALDKALEIFQNPPTTASNEQKSDFSFWKAETLHRQKKWDAAVEAYQALSKDFPESLRLKTLPLNLSEALLSAGKSQESVEVLAPLLALKTTDKERHPAVLQQARILTTLGQFADADALLVMLLKEKLDRGVLYQAAYLSGEINLQLKKWVEAKASFRRLTEDSRAYPESLVAQSWLGIGAAEEAEQKWAPATNAYEKALEFSNTTALFERSVVRYLSTHAKADTLAKGTLKVRQLARERKDAGAIGFYAIGKFYFEAKNFDAAISELDNFINNNPDSPWVTASKLLIANCLYEKKEVTAATTNLKALIDEKKDKDIVFQARLRLAEILYEQGDYKEASDYFLAAAQSDVASNPIFEGAYFRGLISLAKAGNLDDFIKQLSVFTTKYPASFKKNDLLLEQAVLLEARGKSEEARKLYETVVTANAAGSKPEALLRLGRSFYEAADYAKAIDSFYQLEKSFPSYASLDQVVYLRIMAQVESGLIKGLDARTEYESFITRFPESSEIPMMSFKLAESYSQDGNFFEAQKRFEKVAADFPKAKGFLADFALYRAGLSSMAQAEYKNAVIIFEKIVNDSPAKTASRLAQIRCYMARNNYVDAIRICDSVILNHKEDEDWAEASIRKANCLYTLAAQDEKNYPLALEITSKILVSKNVSIHRRNEAGHLKGAILQKLGRSTEAMEAYLDVVYAQALPSEVTGIEPHPEFYWLIKSGLAAATMREDKGDVRGAVEIYRILERLGDPNREEFRRKIEALKSKNFLYEES